MDSGAAVNYLYKYCLYCASTVVLLMCVRNNLQFGAFSAASGKSLLIAEVITDSAVGDK